MNKDFHDLLRRYVIGDCTAEEIEKVNQWYTEIADKELQLDEEEKTLIKARTLANIREVLPAHIQPHRKHRHMVSYPIFRVAAAIMLLALGGLWLLTPGDSLLDGTLSETSNLSDEVIFENETDSTHAYTLSDSSRIQLGPSGKIRFARNFSAGKREVYLTGKAFFDIEKDSARPFYVYTGTIATRVLGTSFFVDAPANCGKVEIKVITGKVSVFQILSRHSSESERPSSIKNSTVNGVVLSPNQKVEYFIEGGHWVTGLVEDPVPVKSIDEHTLSFVFDNARLTTVFEDINERFGIEVLTENEKISECTFTGDVSKMTLYDLLDVISNSIGSTYEVRGTRILVSGKGCH